MGKIWCVIYRILHLSMRMATCGVIAFPSMPIMSSSPLKGEMPGE